MHQLFSSQNQRCFHSLERHSKSNNLHMPFRAKMAKYKQLTIYIKDPKDPPLKKLANNRFLLICSGFSI